MLTPDTLFAVCNTAALPAWAALGLSLFFTRIRKPVWIATGLALPGLLALAYVGSLIAGFASGASGGFNSIAAVRSLFANDHALTAGWVHYLAFDMIVGTMIARDAARAGISGVVALPVLVLTFLFGPAGLLAWMVIRLAVGGRITESLS